RVSGWAGGRRRPPRLEGLALQGEDHQIAVGPALPVPVRKAADLLAADLLMHPQRCHVAGHDLRDEQPQSEPVENKARPGETSVEPITLPPEIAPPDQGAGGRDAVAPVDAIDAGE